MTDLKRQKMIDLPIPKLKGSVSVEQAIAMRQSVRQFTAAPLSLAQISQLLWAGQGITRNWGGRAAPSAGASYPLELYITLKEGLFHYRPENHKVENITSDDVRAHLADAALGQDAVRRAPAVIIITAVYERTRRKYRGRAERYVEIEVGHAAQNVMLQATALGLGAVPVGAFEDERIRSILKLPPDQHPLYIIAVGYF